MNRYIALKNIVETGSLTRAADRMGYSQSAISQMVTSLEQELDLRLLNRSRNGAKLTPEGEDLYPYLKNLVYQYEALQEKVTDIKGLETGVIRMGTIASISIHWLPAVLKEYKDQYPGVEFVLHQGDYTSIQEWIRTGMIDLGFTSPAATLSGIQYETLKEGEMLAVLPKGHPLCTYEKVPLNLLAKEPFILLEEGHYSEPMEAFKAHDLIPNTRYVIHDDHSIMAMVESGLGVSILPKLIMNRTNFNLETRSTDPGIFRTLAIGYKDRAGLSMASKRFIQMLKGKLSELP